MVARLFDDGLGYGMINEACDGGVDQLLEKFEKDINKWSHSENDVINMRVTAIKHY